MDFFGKLNTSIEKNNSLLCVGLDPVINKLPVRLQGSKAAFFEFNKAIIDATAELVCAYKPNSAFYEALGADGILQLKQTIEYLNETFPHIPVILDAKRADIGNTNEGYIDFIFDYLNADGVTLHPYLGREALEPFLNLNDKGIIVLCRTSNPGANEFQDLIHDDQPVYQHVAKNVADKWNANGNCLLVIGATYPEEMKIVRDIVGPNMTFLVPGVGAQGGDIGAVMSSGLDANGRGLIINSGRDIIYASGGEDFADVARERALGTRDEINTYR